MKTAIFTLLASIVFFMSSTSYAQALPRTPGCIRHWSETGEEPAILNKVLSMGNYTALFGTWEKKHLGHHFVIFISANDSSFILKLKGFKTRTFQVCDVPKKANTLKLVMDDSPFKNGDKTVDITMDNNGLLDVKLDWIKSLPNVRRTRL